MTNRDRSEQKLTKREVDGARPGKYRYTVWDTEVRGFGVRVEPSGRKTFIARSTAWGVDVLAFSARQQSVDTARFLLRDQASLQTPRPSNAQLLWQTAKTLWER